MVNDRLKLNRKRLEFRPLLFHIHYLKVFFISKALFFERGGGRLPDVLSVSFRNKGVHKRIKKITCKTVKHFVHLSMLRCRSCVSSAALILAVVRVPAVAVVPALASAPAVAATVLVFCCCCRRCCCCLHLCCCILTLLLFLLWMTSILLLV